MKFEELDLRPELNEVIAKIGFSEPTPVQQAVIPHILKGKDVSGLAQTGTGKTGAFVIPLVDRILRHQKGETGERVSSRWKKNSFVLVLVPTRELAVQVEQTVSAIGGPLGLSSIVIAGGSSYEPQKQALRNGVEFVVGTPGRILDLYKSHDLNLNMVEAIVFDEADRMFDMGFKDDMKFLLRRVPRTRQFLLFSATLNFDVLNIAYQFGSEPIEINLSRDNITAEGINHEILQVGTVDKPQFLLSVIKKMGPQQTIVFSNFKHNVTRIARFLKNNGIEATEMSSLLTQAQRNKVIESIKSGNKEILVATDVAARGLDIKGVDLVINYEMPDDPEGYVHRIGRTGRAGSSGVAISLVGENDVDALIRIEEYLKSKLKIGWLDDSELVKDFKPFPTHMEPRVDSVSRRQEMKKRPPRSVPRQERRPPAPTGGISGQVAQQRHGATDSHHRDRKLGRHAHPAQQRTDQQRQQKPRGYQRHHNSNHQHASKRRVLHKPQTTPVKEVGLGQRIKNFFSKIFG